MNFWKNIVVPESFKVDLDMLIHSEFWGVLLTLSLVGKRVEVQVSLSFHVPVVISYEEGDTI